jgi:hypothetical protein
VGCVEELEAEAADCLEVRQDTARVRVRSKTAGDHTREGASQLRRRPQPSLEDDGLSRVEARSAAVSVRVTCLWTKLSHVSKLVKTFG